MVRPKGGQVSTQQGSPGYEKGAVQSAIFGQSQGSHSSIGLLASGDFGRLAINFGCRVCLHSGLTRCLRRATTKKTEPPHHDLWHQEEINEEVSGRSLQSELRKPTPRPIVEQADQPRGFMCSASSQSR